MTSKLRLVSNSQIKNKSHKNDPFLKTIDLPQRSRLWGGLSGSTFIQPILKTGAASKVYCRNSK